MAPRKRAACQVCNDKESRYTCSKCYVLYCSVPCYKQHQASPCSIPTGAAESSSVPPRAGANIPPALDMPAEPDSIQDTTEAVPSSSSQLQSTDTVPLRPLTSLQWPYIPDEPAYPDPLKRDDPKTLQLRQYEAIATSPAVRKALANPKLRDALKSIDSLRGDGRQEALQRALGVSSADVHSTPHATGLAIGSRPDEDVKTMRELAEAIEAAVRGGKDDALGLDWGD